MKHGNVKRIYALLLLLPLISLTGCASTSMPPVISSPALPARPQLSEALPSVPYSKSADGDIQGWRQKLTGTSPTSER